MVLPFGGHVVGIAEWCAYGVCMISGLQMQILLGLLAIYFAVAKADGQHEVGLDLFGTGFVYELGTGEEVGTYVNIGNCRKVMM